MVHCGWHKCHLMFTFLGWEIRMAGKLFADHKLESCYCIHGDASRIAGTWCGLCHYYMVEVILLIWSKGTGCMLSFYYIYSASLTDIFLQMVKFQWSISWSCLKLYWYHVKGDLIELHDYFSFTVVFSYQRPYFNLFFIILAWWR